MPCRWRRAAFLLGRAPSPRAPPARHRRAIVVSSCHPLFAQGRRWHCAFPSLLKREHTAVCISLSVLTVRAAERFTAGPFVPCLAGAWSALTALPLPRAQDAAPPTEPDLGAEARRRAVPPSLSPSPSSRRRRQTLLRPLLCGGAHIPQPRVAAQPRNAAARFRHPPHPDTRTRPAPSSGFGAGVTPRPRARAARGEGGGRGEPPGRVQSMRREPPRSPLPLSRRHRTTAAALARGGRG